MISSPLFQKGKYLVTFLFFIFSPALYTEASIDPSNANRFLAVPLLAFILLIGNKALVLPAPRLLQLAGVYTAVLIAGMFVASSVAEVIFESAKWLSFVCCLVVAVNAWYYQKNEVLWALRYTCTIVAATLVIYLLPLIVKDRAALYSFHPFYEHHNTIASALLVLGGLQVYDVIVSTRFARWHAVLNVALVLLLVVLLQVRSVYVALLAASVLLAAIAYSYKNYKGILLALLPALVLAVFYFSTSKGVVAKSTAASISLQSSSSMQERFQFWKKSVLVIKDHPLLGCGAGNWQFAYAKYGINGISNLEQGISVQHPHNELLSIWSEQGTLGLVVFILMLVFVARQFFYEFSKRENQALALLAALLVAIGVEACFSFPKERILNLFAIAVVAALLLTELKLITEVSVRKRSSTKLLITVLLLLIATVATYRFKGEFYTKQLLKFQADSKPREMLSAGAAAESFVYKSDPTSSPIAGYLGAAYYALNRPDSMVMQCQLALELAPYDYETLSNLGFALTRFGDKNEARRLLQEALRINAKYDGAWLNLAILDFSLRKYEDAYHEILQIENVQEKYPEQLGAIQAAAQQQLQGY